MTALTPDAKTREERKRQLQAELNKIHDEEEKEIEQAQRRSGEVVMSCLGQLLQLVQHNSTRCDEGDHPSSYGIPGCTRCLLLRLERQKDWQQAPRLHVEITIRDVEEEYEDC